MRQAPSSTSASASIVLSAAAALAAAGLYASPASGQVLFSDSFDTNTSANYSWFSSNPTSDFGIEFGKDYSTMNYEVDDGLGGVTLVPVPVNPRSPGSTAGLVMRINDTSNQVNSLSAYPKLPNGDPRSFSGNYKLSFDMFMAYNGGALGGNASTEWMLAGINQGAVGNRVAGPLIQAQTATLPLVTGENTGNTFASSGEGGSGTDYRTYINQTNQVARGFAATGTAPQNHNNAYYTGSVFPNPPFETVGAPGKQWVAVEMMQIDGVITWTMNDWLIASYRDTTHTSGNITLGYMDVNATSVSGAEAPQQYVLYDNMSVVVPTRTVYWDTNGSAAAGAGGAAPVGAWNSVAVNFNTDSAGAAGGITTRNTHGADTVVFTAGADGTGTYAVDVVGTQYAGEVQVARGNVTFAGTGTVATGSFDVAAGATGTVSSLVSGNGAGSVTKKGAGTLTLTANNTYTGGTNVQAGTLRVNRLHESNPVNITGGKLQVVDSSPTLPAHPAGNNASVSRPSALAIANNGAALGARTYNGQLDLGNNDLILDYTGASPIADIEDMVRAGFNGGNWLGNGITSSTANANSNFAVGVADNARLTNKYDGTRLFSGQAVDETTILVKFTHRIDLDLDGVITTNDATIFNSNYAEGAPAYWSIGDLDYDRVFTTNDATLFNSFYSEALASVPEPGTVGVLGLAGLGLLRRRRQPSA